MKKYVIVKAKFGYAVVEKNDVLKNNGLIPIIFHKKTKKEVLNEIKNNKYMEYLKNNVALKTYATF